MSRQTTLEKYFRSKSLRIPLTMSGKKRNLSHRRTPIKTTTISSTTPTMSPLTLSKEVVEVKTEEEIVILSSDSEHETTPTKRKKAGISVRSIESLRDRTPVYTAQQQSPVELGASVSNSSLERMDYNMSPGVVLGTSPRTPSSQRSNTNGFYSPTKKRVVKMKSPAKRNLASQFNESFSPNSSFENQPFAHIIEDKDDKTGFLVSIIDKYLKSETLKPLLEEDSQELLKKCMQVVKPGMKLMCRLYWRRLGWYRIEELGQIATDKKNAGDKEGERMSSPDLLNMISCLKGFGLITQAGTDGEPDLQFDEYVKLLKRPDILQIAKDLKLKMQSKQSAVEALRAFSKCAPISKYYSTKNVSNNSTRILEIFKSKTGNCYKMSDLARTTFYNLYVLMYLGIDYNFIRDKKLEYMLINDKTNRETFPVDKQMVVDDASVVFQNREEFYRYLQAHVAYEKYLEETDLDKKCELIKEAYNMFKGIEEEHMSRYKKLPTWQRRFTPPNIYVKILESGVQELKKQKKEECYKLALEMLKSLIGQIAFRQHHKARWYAEMALILHTHLDSSEEAANIFLAGFRSEDITEEMKDEMRQRALKIANQQNILLEESLRQELRNYAKKEAILESKLPGEHIYKQPMDNYNQRGKLKFEVHTKEGWSILECEEYCIQHYINSGQFTNGGHWEGRIVSTIFFLLFWDIIYSKPRDIPGIFMSHFQQHPLDMFSESFYLNRKTLIDERLKFIKECSEDKMLALMKHIWDECPETVVSEIQRSIGWESVKEVTSCMGARAVSAVCDRLVRNYGYARSGFPDLTLWNISTKKVKFVEVKTDADKASIKQLQWLYYLQENGIDAGFCYVGVNTTRSKARPSNDI